MKDNQVFNTASAFQEAQGKIPSFPRALENDRDQQAAQMLGGAGAGQLVDFK